MTPGFPVVKGVDAQSFNTRRSQTALTQDDIDNFIVGPYLAQRGQAFMNTVPKAIDTHAKLDGFFYYVGFLEPLNALITDWTRRIEAACICTSRYVSQACCLQPEMEAIRDEIVEQARLGNFKSVQCKFRFSGGDVLSARIQPYYSPNDPRNVLGRDAMSKADLIIHGSKSMPDQAWIVDGKIYKSKAQEIEDAWVEAGCTFNRNGFWDYEEGCCLRNQIDADTKAPKVIAFMPTKVFGNRIIHLTRGSV